MSSTLDSFLWHRFPIQIQTQISEILSLVYNRGKVASDIFRFNVYHYTFTCAYSALLYAFMHSLLHGIWLTDMSVIEMMSRVTPIERFASFLSLAANAYCSCTMQGNCVEALWTWKFSGNYHLQAFIVYIKRKLGWMS